MTIDNTGPVLSSESNPELKENDSRLKYAVASIPSSKHPDVNEDFLLAKPESGYFGVFDGVSMADNGERSAKLVAAMFNGLANINGMDFSDEEIKDMIKGYLENANKLLYDSSLRTGEVLQTTAVVAYIRKEGEAYKITIGNVGDSRVYSFSEGSLEQLTIDDSAIKLKHTDREEQKRIQKKLSNTTKPNSLSPEELALFKNRRTIIQSIGMERIKPSIEQINAKEGDLILLTTDGIHDNLTDDEIEDIVRRCDDPDTIKDLIARAAILRSNDRLSQRSKRDDMTVMVVRLGNSKTAGKTEGSIRQGWANVDEGLKISDREKVISAVSSFDELFSALKSMDGIGEGDRHYPSNLLISIISRVRAGESDIDNVTKQLGLRKKVRELMEINQKRSEILQITPDNYVGEDFFPLRTRKEDGSADGVFPLRPTIDRDDNNFVGNGSSVQLSPWWMNNNDPVSKLIRKIKGYNF